MPADVYTSTGYTVETDVRQIFRSRLWDRANGESPAVRDIRKVYSFTLHEAPCQDDIIPKMLYALNELYLWILADEKRRCPQRGKVKVTLHPSTVKHNGLPVLEVSHMAALTGSNDDVENPQRENNRNETESHTSDPKASTMSLNLGNQNLDHDASHYDVTYTVERPVGLPLCEGPAYTTATF